jgi:UDP-N-acetyl-D-mannosaminuronic acid transferase (WecB/TagA/CpsF family)
MSHDIDLAQTERVLGVRFFTGTAAQAVAGFTRSPGLMLVVALPALIKLQYEEGFRRALQEADLVLADSGLLAGLWKSVTGRKFRRVSGVEYLEELLETGVLRNPGVLWIVRSREDAERALSWLRSRGCSVEERDIVAPESLPASSDHDILLQIEERKPRHVIIATAVGGQEALGLYLKEYLLHRTCLHCVGSALAVLIGTERRVAPAVERVHLGWLARLIVQPAMTLPRLGMAFVISRLVIKYRSELPPLKQRWADV